MMSPSVALVVALLCTVIHKSNADYIDDFTDRFLKYFKENNVMFKFDLDKFGDVQALADAFQEATNETFQLLDIDPGTAPTDMRDAVVEGTSNYGSAIPKEKWAEMVAQASAITLAGKGALREDNVEGMVEEYVMAFDIRYDPLTDTVDSNIYNVIYGYYATLNLLKVIDTEDGWVFATGRFTDELYAICTYK